MVLSGLGGCLGFTRYATLGARTEGRYVIDLGTLTEDDVQDLAESVVLDFDDENDLRAMLVDRLRSEPYERYLSLCASYLADIRGYLGAEAGDERGLDLLARTIDAASGAPVGSLLADWDRYARSDGDADGEYDGLLSVLLFGPCSALAYELTTSTQRYRAAEEIADAALECVDDVVAGENLRMLMRFVVRAAHS